MIGGGALGLRMVEDDTNICGASPPPFIVYTLPRSRSAWLSHFLGPCGHDIGLDCLEFPDFITILDGIGGTVETGAIIAAKAIQALRPDIRRAVIRRPLNEIFDSLQKIGLPPSVETLEERAGLLDELSKEPGVLTLGFEHLSDFDACATLMEHLRGTPCSRHYFEYLSDFNIQLDMPRRIRKLQETAPAVAHIKRQLASFGTEHVGSC